MAHLSRIASTVAIRVAGGIWKTALWCSETLSPLGGNSPVNLLVGAHGQVIDARSGDILRKSNRQAVQPTSSSVHWGANLQGNLFQNISP